MSPSSTNSNLSSISPNTQHSLVDSCPPQRSNFYARFSRRQTTPINLNHSSSFAATTSNLLATNTGSSLSHLLRSSSSSQLPLHSSAPSQSNNSHPSTIQPHIRLTSTNLATSSSNNFNTNTNMTTTNASSTQITSTSAGGSALGRMFRRYSQGGAARAENQRPSTRDRDRDTFNVQPNNSSPALDRDNASPMRTSINPYPVAAASSESPSVLRSTSHASGSSIHPSLDAADAPFSASRTLASMPSASANAVAVSAATATPSPLPAFAPASASGASQNLNSPSQNRAHPDVASTHPIAATSTSSASPAVSRPLNSMHRIRLVPHLEATRSLHFEPIERDLKQGVGVVKVGRFTDRQPAARDPVVATLTASTGAPHEPTSSSDFGSAVAPPSRGQPGARGGAIPISGSHGGGGRIDSSRIAFKSKVVSRGHAEIWCEPGGNFFIRDTKSSSGTFLNHIRLSAPNMESKPFPIKDGDVIQLGVDYQGGTEEIYRCVKMRVELNRGWQREANQFNVNALRQLRALQGTSLSPPQHKPTAVSAPLPTNRQVVSVTDCCICLFSVTVCQALFIAPCSHVFHYKCIRPLLNLHHPGFSCPLCRTFADLDADVEEDEAWQAALLHEAAAAEARLAQGKQPLEVSTPAVEIDAPITATLPPTLITAILNDNASATTSSPAPGVNVAAARSSLGSTASPVLTPSLNPSLARGTAALNKRKNDWARPDTAVGSSAGPLAADETFVVNHEAETAAMSNHVQCMSEELGEMVVTDRLLNEHTTASADAPLTMLGASLQQPVGPGASETGSPIRRGSGPIAIGGGERTMRSSSQLAAGLGAAATLASLEEGWTPTGGFSPGLQEAGTPLNHTFLSTLAEAPHMTAGGPSNTSPSQDFPTGRSAPAQQTLVPAIIPVEPSRTRAAGENGATNVERSKRSSDGGEDVDTAEEEVSGPAGTPAFANAVGAGHAKGKAKSSLMGNDHQKDALADSSIKLPHVAHGAALFGAKSTATQRGRSRSRSRAGKGSIPSDSDDPCEAAPFQPYEHRAVPRTGPNLNASAYMRDQTSNVGNRQVGGERGAESGSPPTSPSGGESKMARFKRRISHAM
ncbi:related to component of the spindle assembly checkpoint dma1 [Melanopsichium pennsylvanicum]|uniref:Related to component of the spindle assembly checkpoint dma1 n=2 Tax=Melanopsichium pennsylvanicum TaxID=63383 RepID=A0AAJ5C5M1_9BASI|nr:related to component of the spindle assembly checkpoint dma1 [Melanopsichium pennsylvanicum 4]SNX84886.1 related to component of the spindle assembly checkpoint dma1 [Melanopsichium pennsylvanicum]